MKSYKSGKTFDRFLEEFESEGLLSESNIGKKINLTN